MIEHERRVVQPQFEVLVSAAARVFQSAGRATVADNLPPNELRAFAQADARRDARVRVGEKNRFLRKPFEGRRVERDVLHLSRKAALAAIELRGGRCRDEGVRAISRPSRATSSVSPPTTPPGG